MIRMIRGLDYFLDRITMYRLVLFILAGLVGVATLFAALHLLNFSPLSLLASTAFLLILCWAMNTVFAYVFAVPTNLESASITALILALIIDPAQTPGAFQFLGWAAILAMTSKYVLAINNRHIFNPAALAVVITSFALGESASWWVGTVSMLPFVLLAGVLITRKMRYTDMVCTFCLTAIVGVSVLTLLNGGSLVNALYQLVVQSPLLFLAFIMLTEPLTAPPTHGRRRVYALLTGFLFLPELHVGTLYSTPELALVVGNIFSYAVSSKQKVLLKLRRKIKMAPDIADFVFKPSQKFTFLPGQYMEFTLALSHPDSRGNRRFFTLASSPTEQDVHVGVRFYEGGSSFKKALYKITGATKLVAGQVAGDFTLPTNPAQKLVFIAGGIGITPFRSMLKYLLDTRQRRDIVLFYVNRRAEEIVYQDVLQAAQTQLGVNIFYTLTDTSAVPRNWRALVGRIQEQTIRSTMPDYGERLYYLSGPPEMVRATESILRRLDVPPSQIKKDFFSGLV